MAFLEILKNGLLFISWLLESYLKETGKRNYLRKTRVEPPEVKQKQRLQLFSASQALAEINKPK